MALFTTCWLCDFTMIFISFLTFFYVWTNKKLRYWEEKGLKNPKTTFFLGNALEIITQKSGFPDICKDWYNYFKENKLIHGGVYFLFRPLYVPVDLDLIKSIMQTDFQHFTDRGAEFDEKLEPLSGHLVHLQGERWKNLRAKLTPTFTSGKMKMMFPTLLECSEQLKIEMNKTVGEEPIEIKDILARFNTDVIGSCAFGIECNSLKNPDIDFRKYGRGLFEKNVWENLQQMLLFIAPGVMKHFNIRTMRKEFHDFFMNVITNTVEYREKNNVTRNDFMHLLLQLKNRGKLDVDQGALETDRKDKEFSITLNELAAQAVVFFLGGFETSSSTATFCLFLLASNPDIQDKLREEINKVLEKHEGKITYDSIMEMTYLEQVINETLRLYPPAPMMSRVCTQEYKVPGTDVVLEEGTKIFIPIMAIHHDEEYYPNPEKFDPDRFSEENKRTRHQYTFLAFGEGPRKCIGLRFGVMQTKLGLTVLLKKYKFTVNSKTVVPLVMDPRSFILSTKGGVWLDYVKI